MGFPIETALKLIEETLRSYQTPVVDLIAAQTRDPFKVLVATILSARTKDEVTAAACRRLFARAETAADLAALSIPELEQLIYPVGFFRVKAAHLHALPVKLAHLFGGLVPSEIEQLLQLPGVGRKTANLVRSVAFDLPAICVDTHVHRITNIWGYVSTQSPVETEFALRQRLPLRYWRPINPLLVAFGQAICIPPHPHCHRCPLTLMCPKLGVRAKKILKEQVRKMGKHFVSWNVNGLRASLRNGLLEVMSRCDADIFAMQEIKIQPQQVPEAINALPGYFQYWHPAEKKGYAGTAVFTKSKPLTVRQGVGQALFDAEGRVLTLEYDDFYFINTYFPNAQPELKRLAFKEAFNAALLDYMQGLRRRKSVVLCGDLNVAHREIDLARPKENRKSPGFSDEERAWMDKFLEAGYIDTFRAFHDAPGNYTWWSYRANARAKNIGWRIDYFLVNAESRERVLDAAIHADIIGSDHCPVSIRFA